MSNQVNPKFHIGDYIRHKNPLKSDRFNGEIIDICEYPDANVYIVQTALGPLPVSINLQDEWEEVFFFIENTVSEYRSAISGYFKTFDEALEGIKECSDWYRQNGTGTIYMKGFGLNSHRQQVYCK